MAQVIRAATPPDGSPCFSSTPLRRTPSPRPSLVTDPSSLPDSLEVDVERYRSRLNNDSPDSSSVSSSPRFDKYSLNSTPPSSVSFDRKDDDDVDDDDANGLYFPTYDYSKFSQPQATPQKPESTRTDSQHDETPASLTESSSTIESSPGSPGPKQIVDDTAVHEEPSRQVDYLSHDWREEDIWCSWKHIVSKRKIYGEYSRLENASWRTWAKSKYQLKTISPETLNWLKDCDVTWLYGPLQESSLPRHNTGTSSNISKSNSFINKKPILKKRSVSEVMLQKSLSNSSLVRQAAAAVQAQRSCLKNGQNQPRMSRTPSEFIISSAETGAAPTAFTSSSSSGIVSPESGRKHIRFDDKVEQCIAVDFEPTSQGEDSSGPSKGDDVSVSSEEEEEDDDEDVIMLKTKSKRPPPSSVSSSRRSSIGQESKGIVKLPSTKLKSDDQESDDHDEHSFNRGSHHMGGRLQPSSSQETLRPTDPASNFLIDDDDDADLSWQPSGAFADGIMHQSGYERDRDSSNSYEAEYSNGLRRTPSGMFMPFDEDEDEEEQQYSSSGMLGRVVDTVNTARDIMHVIMNVGWRS